jgi:hypothetical protein
MQRTEPRGSATDPPPRVCWVARTERSPGFGTSLAFPVFPVAIVSEEPGHGGQVPVTVAGPRRVSTGFRVAPFVLLQFFCCAILSAVPPGRKRSLQPRLDPASLREICAPLLL